jgi:SAM-dependent methyltransferase
MTAGGGKRSRIEGTRTILEWRCPLPAGGPSPFHTSHTEVEAELLRQAIGPGAAVLEAGCGRTSRLRSHRDRIERLVGVDLDEPGGRTNEFVDEFVVADLCGALPFADETFDVVSAFDVIEHCADDGLAVAELVRVLAPGGRVLLSVPAYQWAWTDHDDRAGHHRRYTRRDLCRLVEGAGPRVDRATYAFGAVFPIFLAERARRRLRRAAGPTPERLPRVSPRQDRILTGLSDLDRQILAHTDLPFGSSIFLAAVKAG